MYIEYLLTTYYYTFKKNKTMRNNFEILEELRQGILARIKICDGKVMPFVCEMAKTTKGRNTIVQYCTNLVAQADYSVIDALMEKEREINPNMIKD